MKIVAGLLVVVLVGDVSFLADGSPEPPVPPPIPDVIRLSLVLYLDELPWLDSQSPEDWLNEKGGLWPDTSGPSNHQLAILQVQVALGRMSLKKHLSVSSHAHSG